MDSGYLLEGLVLTEIDVNYDSAMIIDPQTFKGLVQVLFAADSSGSSGIRRNIFLLEGGVGEKGKGLYAAKVLLLF